MKCLFLSAIIFATAFISNAQLIIQSIKLDSAIYNEVNRVRIQNNQPALTKFLFGDIRKFSYTVTENNCSNTVFEHSLMDSTKKYCNAECIYRYKLTCGNGNAFNIDKNPTKINELATNVVNSWMNSLTHHDAILRNCNQKITITSRIEIAADGKSAIISVSYHAVQTTTKIGEIPYGLRSNSSYYMK